MSKEKIERIYNSRAGGRRAGWKGFGVRKVLLDQTLNDVGLKGVKRSVDGSCCCSASSLQYEENNNLIDIWVEQVLANWKEYEMGCIDSNNSSSSIPPLVKSLVSFGVPQEIRGEYWKRAIGNELRLTPEYYRIILTRLKSIRSNLIQVSPRYMTGLKTAYESVGESSLSSSNEHYYNYNETLLFDRTMIVTGELKSRRNTIDGFTTQSSLSLSSSPISPSDPIQYIDYEIDLIRKSFESIAVDLHRTLPKKQTEYIDTQSLNPARDHSILNSLRSILESFCIYRPDVGYVQGMAYIAATLLITMDEYSAFVCLANLLFSQPLLSFYSFEITVIRRYCLVFELLLQRYSPRFWANLSQSSFKSDIFLIEWWFTLFTRSLPTDLLLHVWDSYLLYGDLILFQTSLAIIKYHETQLNDSTIENAMVILSSSPSHHQTIDQSKFLNCIKRLKLSPKRLQHTFLKAANISIDPNKHHPPITIDHPPITIDHPPITIDHPTNAAVNSETIDHHSHDNGATNATHGLTATTTGFIADEEEEDDDDDQDEEGTDHDHTDYDHTDHDHTDHDHTDQYEMATLKKSPDQPTTPS